MMLRKSQLPIFQVKVDFSELSHCEQTHHPIMMVVPNRQTSCVPRQQRQQWLRSSLSASHRNKRDANQEIDDRKGNQWQNIADHSG